MIGPSDHRVIGSLVKPCTHPRTTVISTWRSGHIICRRRACLDCEERFDTDEKPRIAANGNNLHCRVKTD